MDRSQYRDEFEELLREKADQYKMYPSDRVWKGINGAIQPRRKWYRIGLVVLLTSLGLYSVTELFKPVEPDQINNTGRPAESTAAKDQSASEDIIPFKPLISSTPAPARIVPIPIGEAIKRDEAPVSKTAAVTARVIPLAGHTERAVVTGNRIEAERVTGTIQATQMLQPDLKAIEEQLDRERSEILGSLAINEELSPKKSRYSLQFTFSPTVSYRRMSGNNRTLMGSSVGSIPNALNIRGDVDQLVNHLPAPGLELGSAVLYTVNKRLRVKAGLQLNYSRYAIRAFQAPAEIATIALHNRSGIPARSLQNVSKIRNFGGNEEAELQNQYLQISAPVGMEFYLAGNKKLQFGLAATVQPGYLLNSDNYLISADYKNYIHQPSLLRKWNLHTGAEAFVAYQTPTTRWQVGPQFRYQLLSSYVTEYPVREHMLEYGVKIAVSKAVW